MDIQLTLRDMNDGEYKKVQSAFDEHGIQFGNPPEKQKRFGYVATIEKEFVGASSGLAQMNNKSYGNYFYLTDLLVEKEYRNLGYGKRLLEALERKIQQMGIKHCWTWTAEHEAKTFYQKQGYDIFVEFTNYYPSGHARIGLIKKL